MTELNQATQYSRHLLSKSLQSNFGRKSRIKNKKDQSWRMITDVGNQVNGLGEILYRSPHENVERSQILRITAKKYQELDKPVLFQADHSFLKLCKNGLYDFTKFLKLYSQIQSCTEEQIESSGYIQFGKNTIPYAQQKKVKQISKKIPDLRLPQGTLKIRGDFQCGNLQRCIKTQRDTYVIILRNDTNTQGYTQWFHFYLQSNFREKEMLKFIIVNIRKPIKYVDGMKLLTRGHRIQTRNHEEWSRNLNFVQFQTSISSSELKKYHAIAFCISSVHLQNGIFICLSYPYPISRLRFLGTEMITMGSELKIIQIGKSALQNSIFVFRLQNYYPKQKKKSIIILARQHSSETSSSFICQFIIKRLTIFNTFDRLTKQFNWHIIPVANPDGVVLGNSRTNMKGFDMNRCWAPYLLTCSPEAQCINNYLQTLDRNPEDIYIDLHTHSRDLGFFTYAHCENYFVKTMNSKMKEICPYFQPQKCKIGYDVKKRNTFRIQIQNRFKIKNTMTIQTSFYGYTQKQTGLVKQFVLYDYEQMAICILQCLDYYRKNESMPGKSQKETQIYSRNLSESSSDSDPQGDYLNEEDRKQVQEHVQTQVVKKISFNSLNQNNSVSQKTIIAHKKSISKQKKTENPPNVVNLYNGVNSFSIKATGLSKSKRIMSACMKQQSRPNRFQPRSIFSERSKQLSNQNHFKSERKSCENSFSSQNYLERKSFRNLFANAHKRNENVRFEQKILKFQSKSERKQKTKASNQEDQGKKITTLIFPSSHQIDNQIIKQLGQTLQKKTIFKSGKGHYFDRKTKLNKNQRSTSKTNEKIATLCEYVRKLEKTQIFF